jgi:hypothetical protein
MLKELSITIATDFVSLEPTSFRKEKKAGFENTITIDTSINTLISKSSRSLIRDLFVASAWEASIKDTAEKRFFVFACLLFDIRCAIRGITIVASPSKKSGLRN